MIKDTFSVRDTNKRAKKKEQRLIRKVVEESGCAPSEVRVLHKCRCCGVTFEPADKREWYCPTCKEGDRT